MISELNIGNVVLPLEDGREIITRITPYKVNWDKELQGHTLTYHENGTRKQTPQEMLISLKAARDRINRALRSI